MSEEINFVHKDSKSEKLIQILKQNKKMAVAFLIIIILTPIIIFSLEILEKNNKKKLSEEFNNLLINKKNFKKDLLKSELVKIVESKNDTYSPLALYYLLDEDLIDDEKEINELFDILIYKTDLKDEFTELLILKKAIFNSNFEDDQKFFSIIQPLINSKSIWKSQALYLAGEYYLSKNEMIKSKEFFEEILTLENSSSNLISEVKIRLSRDFK